MKTRHFLLAATAFWLVFGTLTGIQVWISMLEHGHSVPLLLSYFIAVWLAWVVPTYCILGMARRFPLLPLRASAITLHALAAAGIAIVHALYEVALMLWMQPYDRMTASLSEIDLSTVLLSRMPMEWMLYSLVLGCVLAFEYYQRYLERALRAAQLERSLADARLHMLELQLRPHFLFNTLNAVAGLVRSRNNAQAVTMIAGLADLLRYSLEQAERQRVALAQETVMLERYLEIELARFPDRLSFHIAIDAEAARGLVPGLILQPLVENAVRHGIANLAAPGTVRLQAQRSGERLQLCIYNSGVLSADPVEGIGLRNTRERLRSLYGDAAHFSLTAVDGGVLATIELPWQAAA
ncbi:MAG: histidine kinase [Rhodanobacteraceae bacterium]|nr:histidine kinase [Rhodanobacteraceae bacterium]